MSRIRNSLLGNSFKKHRFFFVNMIIRHVSNFGNVISFSGFLIFAYPQMSRIHYSELGEFSTRDSALETMAIWIFPA